ncbi:hypothetical protein BH09BAC1_BH09BAC1_26300 [soil metagenome]
MAEGSKEDSLFQLIRSMTKAEKRYFKINSTHTIGDKNSYMRLFEAMDGITAYDDAKFRQKFKKEPFVKYLAAEKNYLYELILKSLRGSRYEKSKYLKLLGLLNDVDLLFEKRMFEECEKRIKKAQKIAVDMNYFHINGLLIDWKFILLSRLQETSVSDVLKEYNDEILLNQKTLDNFYSYRKLKNDALVISKKAVKINQPNDERRISEIFSSVFLQQPELANSFIAKLEYYSMLGQLYRAQIRSEEEYNVRKEHLKLFENFPEMVEEYPNKYSYALSNFLVVAVRVSDFEGYEQAIEKLGLDNPDQFKETKVINMGGNQMFYLMNNSRWPEAVKLSNILEDMLLKYRAGISWTQIITIKYNAGCLQFILGKYSEAVDRFDFVINEKQETYMGQLLASRVLHLICHYEISPITVVESLLGSANRFAAKVNDKNSFNEIILKGIRKLTRTIDKSETRAIMTQMREDLLLIFEEYQFGLGLEETICWLTSRIENRTVLEVVNERLEIERQMAIEKLKQQEK